MFSFIKYIASGKSLGNGKLVKVRSVKNFAKVYRHFSFFYFRLDFEWECTWYVVTKLKSSGFLFISGAKAFTIESINFLYSSTLTLVNIGTSRTHKNFLVPEIQL